MNRLFPFQQQVFHAVSLTRSELWLFTDTLGEDEIDPLALDTLDILMVQHRAEHPSSTSHQGAAHPHRSPAKHSLGRCFSSAKHAVGTPPLCWQNRREQPCQKGPHQTGAKRWHWARKVQCEVSTRRLDSMSFQITIRCIFKRFCNYAKIIVRRLVLQIPIAA